MLHLSAPTTVLMRPHCTMPCTASTRVQPGPRAHASAKGVYLGTARRALSSLGGRLAENGVASYVRGKNCAARPSKLRMLTRPALRITAQAAASNEMHVHQKKTDWLGYITSNPKADLLAGITVSLALVPEAVAFTFVAGVNPLVGLHGAFLMCLVTSFLGGRPALISGAAGATAVVTGALVVSKGVEYLFACMAMAGVFQLAFGAARLGKLIRLVPRAAMLGFVNGLAVVILSAQAEHFMTLNAAGAAVWMTGAPLVTMIGLVGLTMAIIEGFPKLTKAVPAPLAAITIVTALVQTLGLNTRTLGDMSSISGTMPIFHIPTVPATLETLTVVAPYAAAVAAVGLIETLLTQNLVDELTQSRTPTHIECLAQGLGNIVNGFFGGMGGCAMIGQTMININSGGRGRLSGITCAACVGLFIVSLSSQIEKIPLAALVGVMVKVVIDTFAWSSLTIMHKIPKTDVFVLIAVTAVTVYSNLAVAVIFGVIVSALGFAYKQSKKIEATRTVEASGYEGNQAAVYTLQGPLFFGSVMGFKDKLDPVNEAEKEVVLDFMDCRVWDQSALEAIDSLASRYSERGKQLHLRHLSRDCQYLLKKAGDLVEVNVLEDPVYGVGTDYAEEAIYDENESPEP